MRIASPLRQIRRVSTTFLLGVVLLSACGEVNNSTLATQQALDHPDVLVSFNVELPGALSHNSHLSIEWIDPLASINLNPTYLSMEKVDDWHYTLDVPAKKGEILQYRYVATGATNQIEIGTDGKPLNSRFYYLSGHSQIMDRLSGFTTPSAGFKTGAIEGSIRLKDTSSPPDGILVSVAGLTTITDFTGYFRLQGVPIGTQNVTIFSPQGLIEPFQQQAIIEENNTTPIDIDLVTRKLVNVSFIVTTPGNTPSLSSLRLFGNLAQLGNSYAGLFGSGNIVQNKGPVLSKQSDSKYLVVLQLPEKSHINYIYSLGDTFWNRELTSKGEKKNRSIFIASHDMEIEDRIENWNTSNLAPVKIKYLPPPSTLPTDRIQLQFDVYGWMEPVDIWPVGDGSYEFTVFNPLNFSAPVNYRFCRSNLCGTVDSETLEEQIISFQAGTAEQTFPTVSSRWAKWTNEMDPTVVTTERSDPKYDGFNTIVEFSDTFRPYMSGYFPTALDAVGGLNANTVIIPVSWTFRSANPLWLSLDLSQNPTNEEIRNMVSQAKEKGLKTYLMTFIQYETGPRQFWSEFSQNQNAWKQWFTEVRGFYRSTAFLAQSLNVDGLIIGDEVVSSVLGRKLINKDAVNSFPDDGSLIFNEIVSELKNVFTEKLLLAINYDDYYYIETDIINNVDGIYFLNLGPITAEQSDIQSYAEVIAEKFSNDLGPDLIESAKNAWVGLDYPSIISADTGCVELSGSCQSASILNYPAPAQPAIIASLNQQANLYNAIIPEANRQAWINGISTRRFFIVGNYQDQSSSIRGKPAADVVWFWFATMMGIPTN